MKKFTMVIIFALCVSGRAAAQDAGNVKFIFQVPIGGELGLNQTPGAYLNLLAGLGVDYVPLDYSVHLSYIPFAAQYSSIDINAGLLFGDNTDIEERRVMIGPQDFGNKIQMTYRSAAMDVRSFKRIRLGYNRMFTTNIEKRGNHKINTFYAGYEASDIIDSKICALNSFYVDLMYGTYDGQIEYRNDMNKYGGRIGFSNDWGWSVSTIEEIGYKPISGITLLWACQIFFML